MKKYLSPADLACYELENINLDKLVSRIVSELQQPVLCLKREPITDDHSHKSYLVYRLYFRSHIDTHFTLVKLFRSLDDFCIWYVSSHPYRDFKLVNYSQL